MPTLIVVRVGLGLTTDGPSGSYYSSTSKVAVRGPAYPMVPTRVHVQRDLETHMDMDADSDMKRSPGARSRSSEEDAMGRHKLEV